MPTVEFDVDTEVVRRLLVSQYAPVDPVRAAAPLVEFGRGWDNIMFRLGDDLLVRLPVRQQSAPLIDNEARWLPEIGPRLPIPTPEVIFTGRAEHGYPWSWNVQTWLAGEPVATLPVPQRNKIAPALAATMLALHTEADPAAPVNRFRGVPLAERSEAVEQRRPRVQERLGTGATALLYDVFHAGVSAPRWPGPPVWVHGDPHPFNLLHHGGDLVGLIDFGDVTSGDPATDLAAAWWALDAQGRRTFVEMVTDSGQYDDSVFLRARAWAASFVTAVSTDVESREQFASVVEHTVSALAGANQPTPVVCQCDERDWWHDRGRHSHRSHPHRDHSQ